MEYTNNKKKISKINLFMVIGYYILIVIFLITLIVLIKNVNEIKTDPIVYGVRTHNYAVCTCYDMEGNSFDFNKDGFIRSEIGMDGGWNIQLPNVSLD